VNRVIDRANSLLHQSFVEKSLVEHNSSKSNPITLKMLSNTWVVTIGGGLIVLVIGYYVFGIGKSPAGHTSNTSSTQSKGVFFDHSTLTNSPVTYTETNNVAPEVPKISENSVADKNSAFITVVPKKISKNTIRPDVSKYIVEYDVVNSGTTPADKAHVTLYFVSDNKVTGSSINDVYSTIAPHMSTENRDAITNDLVDIMQFGTNNYLQIVVQYYDYAGKVHKHVSELQIQPGATDPLNAVLVTKREFEG
jgi:hypothetical protein